MKKKSYQRIFHSSGGFKKMFLVMRLSVLLLLVSVLSAVGNSYSQSTKFSLRLNNATIKQVFTEIEENSEYIIVYSDDILDVSKEVSVIVKNSSVDKILDQIFSGTAVDYTIKDRQIVITQRVEDPLVDTSQQAENIVSGKVVDSEGLPLPGVTVAVKGTTSGTITDFDGQFSLQIPDNSETLVFSFVGFETQELVIGNQKVFNIQLAESMLEIEEVVAVGYGTQYRREISGSISNISEKNFNQGVNSTAVDLLKGKVAGLTITRGSGDITSDQTIRLRGTSSLTGSSQPFIVIDGVPGMSLSSVAPQDIESISVLKDAASAAIYGSRSASGVILITTKKGSARQSIVEYEGYVAIDEVINTPDVLTGTEWRNYASSNGIDTQGLDLGANTDWFDEIMRTGVTQNHNVSFSGGANNHSYRASFNYLDQQGVVNDNSLERYNLRMVFNQKALNDKLDISVTGSMTQKDYSPTDTRNFVLAYNMLPVVPIKRDNGEWYDTQEYDQGNPVRNIEYNSNLYKTNIYYGNIRAELEIVENLKGTVNLLKERENSDRSQYLHSETERGRNDLGYALREGWTRDKEMIETTLDYRREFQESNLNILVGYSYEENMYQKAGAQNRQFVTNFFDGNNIGAGENLRAGDVWSEKNMNKLISFFGRVNYSLKDKYVVTASLRRDGSTKFGENHRWGTFPSVSAAWHINDEAFMSGASFFDDLKFRVGYGISGNQDGLDPYKSLELYGTSGQYYDDGKWYKAYQIAQNANPNLKWEETAMFNIGLDYSIANGRLNGTIEYYDKQTEDLLYTYAVPVPPYLYPEMVANVGSMSNKGFELLINGDIIRKSDLRWNASFNIAHNKNEITKLSNNEFSTSSIKTGDAWIRGGSSNSTHIVEEGKEVGTFYGWRSLGLDEDGMYIMDEMVDGVEGLSDEDRTYIGSAQPKFTYGLANIITYKKWEFNFFFRGVYGNDLLNFSKMSYATTQWLPGANVLHDALTIGLKDNPKYSSFYIEKGSFLRLDNASLSYSFDTSNMKGINKLRLFVTAQNLFTITNYEGLDPEVEMSGLDPGVEGREYYPKSKTFSVGLNIAF